MYFVHSTDLVTYLEKPTFYDINDAVCMYILYACSIYVHVCMYIVYSFIFYMHACINIV